MTSADTNLFLYAANPKSPKHEAAKAFFAEIEGEFATCELVLIELYILLRNPVILPKPLSSLAAAEFCDRVRNNPNWQHVDYEPAVSPLIWDWAKNTNRGYRQIIDARLALTLRFHGVKAFATANAKNFQEFDFEEVWNPVE